MNHDGYDAQMVDRAYGRVVEWQRRVGRQMALVAAMDAQGRDATLAQQTLDALTASLAVLQQHWMSEIQTLRWLLSLQRAFG